MDRIKYKCRAKVLQGRIEHLPSTSLNPSNQYTPQTPRLKPPMKPLMHEAVPESNEDCYTEVESCYTEVESCYTEVESCYTEVGSRYTEVESRYTEVESRYTEVESRYTEVGSRYTVPNSTPRNVYERIDYSSREGEVASGGSGVYYSGVTT